MAIRILCIDDNPDSIVITKRVLDRLTGYVVESAGDAAAGLARIAEQPYDAVICDYRLPGTSGVELLHQLQTAGRSLPIIITTSAGSERVAVEAMKVGAYDYVVKDAAYEELLPGVIQRALDHHRDKQARERLERERNDAIESLRQEKAELQRMNHIMMDREGRVLELKREVNELLRQSGHAEKYQI